jgi:large subunit ribosomal protein L13
LTKTYSAKAEDIEHEWWVVDATDQTLGRLATQIASLLRGKHKPTFTPHVDCGDYVVVINAERIHVTGQKLDQKMYYRHSGYPGGLKTISLRDQLKKRPERVIESAVRGMLPKNRLGRRIRAKLKVYAGPDHPHAGQKPQPFELS